jgi:hypothetical protein
LYGLLLLPDPYLVFLGVKIGVALGVVLGDVSGVNLGETLTDANFLGLELSGLRGPFLALIVGIDVFLTSCLLLNGGH